MGKIPDRWQEYEAMGTIIPGTRFIAFKVPLNMNILRQMDQSDWFSIDDLIGRLSDNGMMLGLVIDLTNTDRYYKKQDITRHEIEYHKIFTEGHVVPSLQVRQNFFGAVDAFIDRNKDNDKVIGVHCTHGLNRTGYLVCRYMIDRLNIAPQEAIDAFNAARGHEMERKNYLNDLLGQNPSSSPGRNTSSSPGAGARSRGRGNPVRHGPIRGGGRQNGGYRGSSDSQESRGPGRGSCGPQGLNGPRGFNGLRGSHGQNRGSNYPHSINSLRGFPHYPQNAHYHNDSASFYDNFYQQVDNGRGSSNGIASSYQYDNTTDSSYDNGSFNPSHNYSNATGSVYDDSSFNFSQSHWNSRGNNDQHSSNSYCDQYNWRPTSDKLNQSTSNQPRDDDPSGNPSRDEQQEGLKEPKDSWQKVPYRRRSPINRRGGDWFEGVRNQSFSGRGQADGFQGRNSSSKFSQSGNSQSGNFQSGRFQAGSYQYGRPQNKRRPENSDNWGASGGSKHDDYGQFGRR